MKARLALEEVNKAIRAYETEKTRLESESKVRSFVRESDSLVREPDSRRNRGELTRMRRTRKPGTRGQRSGGKEPFSPAPLLAPIGETQRRVDHRRGTLWILLDFSGVTLMLTRK